MRRRRFAAALSTILGAPIAGCSGSSEETGTEAPAEQTVYEDALRDELAGEGIEITHLGYDDGRVELEYEPSEASEAGVEESIDATARAYFDRVYGGWNAEFLDASVLVDGSLVVTWHMDTDWIDAYLAGEISREELTERVEESVERHDDGEDDAGPDEDSDGEDEDDESEDEDGEVDEDGEDEDDESEDEDGETGTDGS